MILVEAVLGNAADPEWAARLSAATVDALELDHWEAQKNRFRKKTAGGAEIAVNPETFAVTVDGKHATVKPLKSVNLNQKYFFS